MEQRTDGDELSAVPSGLDRARQSCGNLVALAGTDRCVGCRTWRMAMRTSE